MNLRQHGLTLIELLVALALTAVVGVVLAALVNGWLKVRERLTEPGNEPLVLEFCLALEDSHNGVRAASSAGMMTIMVPDLLDPTPEMHDLCVRIARDLHEVQALIRAAG